MMIAYHDLELPFYLFLESLFEDKMKKLGYTNSTEYIIRRLMDLYMAI